MYKKHVIICNRFHFLAIAILKESKRKAISNFGSMTITIRRGDVGVFDFIQKMESHHFKTNLDHQLRGLFISDKSNFYGEEQLELGIGQGPLNESMSCQDFRSYLLMEPLTLNVWV